jgi:hypothetical protein
MRVNGGQAIRLVGAPAAPLVLLECSGGRAGGPAGAAGEDLTLLGLAVGLSALHVAIGVKVLHSVPAPVEIDVADHLLGLGLGPELHQLVAVRAAGVIPGPRPR